MIRSLSFCSIPYWEQKAYRLGDRINHSYMTNVGYEVDLYYVASRQSE